MNNCKIKSKPQVSGGKGSAFSWFVERRKTCVRGGILHSNQVGLKCNFVCYVGRRTQ